MDFSQITAEALANDPELLESLKSMAASGARVEAIAKQKLKSFIDENFHSADDARKVLEGFNPSLDAEFNLIFIDETGVDNDPTSVLNQIKSSRVSHYIKEAPAPALTSQKKRNINEMPKVNPWAAKTHNRTQQLIMMRDYPPEVIEGLKSAAGAK